MDWHLGNVCERVILTTTFKIARRSNDLARHSNNMGRHAVSGSGTLAQPSLTSATPVSLGTFSAGTYTLTYIGGAKEYSAYSTVFARLNTDSTFGFFLTYNGGSASVQAPGDNNVYTSDTDCQAANLGSQITITHTGGNISIYLNDDPGNYAGNSAGFSIGTPTWELF